MWVTKHIPKMLFTKSYIYAGKGEVPFLTYQKEVVEIEDNTTVLFLQLNE